MLNTHRHIRDILFHYLKSSLFQPTLKPYPSPFSLPFCTNTSDSRSFPVFYLIHNFGFSPKFASKLCSTHRLAFKTAEKPDSVLSFFKNHGFSDTQLHNMIRKTPWLLSCNPYKRVLPKFQFFHSKGASTSDIVNLVSKNPFVLSPSLEKQLVPGYELHYRFLQSDKATFALLNCSPSLFVHNLVKTNIRMLIENGVTDSSIALLLRSNCNRKIFIRDDLRKMVMELKDLGFQPSTATFSIALICKTTVPKTQWNEKVNAFKKWGWSDKDIMEAFKRQPHCMTTSVDKINLVMSFWVNQLGWDALALAEVPRVINCSLQGKIIPRASVVQYLLEKGLRKNNASLTSPFIITDELFLNNYIKRFKEESSYLFKLYEEKLNLVDTGDKTALS